jgi:hypothetical protein
VDFVGKLMPVKVISNHMYFLQCAGFSPIHRGIGGDYSAALNINHQPGKILARGGNSECMEWLGGTGGQFGRRQNILIGHDDMLSPGQCDDVFLKFGSR